MLKIEVFCTKSDVKLHVYELVKFNKIGKNHTIDMFMDEEI